MENIANEKMNKINNAFKFCSQKDFQKAYDIIVDICDEYRISFFPIICLNLGKYKEGANYENVLSNNNLMLITKGNKNFINKCYSSLKLCVLAYDFEKELGEYLYAQYDANATINIREYIRVRKYVDECFDVRSFVAAENCIKGSFEITARDYYFWYKYAQAILFQISNGDFDKLVNPHAIKVLIALKKAIELSEKQEILDYDLHFTTIQTIFALKSFGLELPNLVKSEIENLKFAAETIEEKFNAQQLESNIIKVDNLFPFIEHEEQIIKNEFLEGLQDLFNKKGANAKIENDILKIEIENGFLGSNLVSVRELDNIVKMDMIVPFDNLKNAENAYSLFRFMELEAGSKALSSCTSSIYTQYPVHIKLSRNYNKNSFSTQKIYETIQEIIDLPELVSKKTREHTKKFEKEEKMDKGCLLGILGLIYTAIVIIGAIIVGMIS